MSQSLLDLEARVAALEADRAAKPPRRHLSRKRLGILLLAVALAVPAVVLANDRFSDVPNSNTFHNQINVLAQAGITKGCNPPTNTLYCPADPVRRDQMAAFLIRAAGRMNSVGFSSPDQTPGTPFVTTTIKTEGTAWLDARAAFYTLVQSGGLLETYPCVHAVYLSVDGSVLGDYDGDSSWTRENSAPPVVSLEPQAIEVGAVVGAGTHTAGLVVVDGSGSCDFGIGGGTLSVEVVPFGYLGGTPVAPVGGKPAGGSKVSGGDH